MKDVVPLRRKAIGLSRVRSWDCPYFMDGEVQDEGPTGGQCQSPDLKPSVSPQAPAYSLSNLQVSPALPF